MHVSPFRKFISFSLILFTVSSFVLLFGCGTAPNVPAAPATPSDNSTNNATTLVVWHTFTDKKRETFEALAQDFHKVYPDLNVEPVYVGSHDDLGKQFNAAVALGTAPDLVLADRRQIATFAEQGGLQSLEKFIDDADLGLSNQDKNDFIKGALKLGQYPSLGNRAYGMPFDQEAFVLFYNADYLKTLNINRAPQTWDQFGEWASTATQDTTYGWSMRANADTLEAMLVSRGSALLTDAETRALFNERAGLTMLKLFADLHKGEIVKLHATDDKAQNAFAAGDAAYYMGWLSELDTLRALQKQNKTNFEIGVAPLPQLDAQDPWLLTRGNFFGITTAPQGRTNLQRARNAWFFVRWITAPTQSAQWVRETNAIPLRASTLQFIAPDLVNNTQYKQIADAFDGILPELAAQPAPPRIETIEQKIAGLWLAASQPEADLRAILDDLAAHVNEMLPVKP